MTAYFQFVDPIFPLRSSRRPDMPFTLLGLDTDNDTVFMNETLKAYCDAANIAFTRCRPYHKND